MRKEAVVLTTEPFAITFILVTSRRCLFVHGLMY